MAMIVQLKLCLSFLWRSCAIISHYWGHNLTFLTMPLDTPVWGYEVLQPAMFFSKMFFPAVDIQKREESSNSRIHQLLSLSHPQSQHHPSGESKLKQYWQERSQIGSDLMLVELYVTLRWAEKTSAVEKHLRYRWGRFKRFGLFFCFM